MPQLQVANWRHISCGLTAGTASRVRQIRLDPRLVRLIDTRHFAQLPFAFRIFGREQMTP